MRNIKRYYAMLRDSEEAGTDYKHGVLYHFKYNEKTDDTFFIKKGRKYIEAISTMFDFVSVEN